MCDWLGAWVIGLLKVYNLLKSTNSLPYPPFIPPAGLLKELLNPDEFNRWEDLTLQRTLDAMADLVYCPRCSPPGLEEEDRSSQCALCFFSFCTLCQCQRHVGQQCRGARGPAEDIAAAMGGREGWEGGWGGAEEEGYGFVESDEESGDGAEELSVVSQVQDGHRTDGGMQ